MLPNGSVIKSQSIADSTIRIHDALYYVRDIFQALDGKIYFALQKYMGVCSFFNQPVESMSAGVFKINNLNNDIEIIPLNENFRKCFCMPHKNSLVAIEILHSCSVTEV